MTANFNCPTCGRSTLNPICDDAMYECTNCGDGLTLLWLPAVIWKIWPRPTSKCNRRAIHEYDHLWGYTKDLYTTPGIQRTVNMDHVVRHYYVSHADLNPKRLVPTGPDVDFTEGHDRDRLPGGPPPELQ